MKTATKQREHNSETQAIVLRLVLGASSVPLSNMNTSVKIRLNSIAGMLDSIATLEVNAPRNSYVASSKLNSSKHCCRQSRVENIPSPRHHPVLMTNLATPMSRRRATCNQKTARQCQEPALKPK